MDRVFLDANVLYSAAYLRTSSLRRLWALKDVELVTSAYAAAEARRNLAGDRPACLPELSSLLERVRIIDEPPGLALPRRVRLEPKDRPILAAAVLAQATHLLTGDRRHFGHLYGKRVQGVLVLVPADYLRAKGEPRRTGATS